MKSTAPRTAWLLGLGLAAALLPAHLAAADEADDRFFQTQIEPVLVQRCYKCHSHQAKIEGGLTLDSRSGWQTGGDGGPALVPGGPEKSRLIAAIGYDDADLKMPPSGKLPAEEIALLTEWVRRGAPIRGRRWPGPRPKPRARIGRRFIRSGSPGGVCNRLPTLPRRR